MKGGGSERTRERGSEGGREGWEGERDRDREKRVKE